MDEINNDGDKMDDVMLPGFRFHPTDEELVGFYLKRKILQRPLSIELIKQLDIYKYDPWDLPKLAGTGEKEWYFYCPRDRKYRNSARPNRVTGAGFWKATGTDRPIYSSEGSKCIGLKKSLVFYRGRAAKGVKTEWMMHEFRLPSLVHSFSTNGSFSDKSLPANDSWAICRIFRKTNSTAQRTLARSYISSSTLPEHPAFENIQPDGTTNLNSHITNTPENMSPPTTNSTSPPTMPNYTNPNNIDMQHSTITCSLDFSSLNDTNQISQKPNGLPDDILNGDYINNANFLFPTHESSGLTTEWIVDFSSNILLNMPSHSVIEDFTSKTNNQQAMLYNHYDGKPQPDLDQQIIHEFSVTTSPEELIEGNVNTIREGENNYDGLDSRWVKNTQYIVDQYEPVWFGGFPYGLGTNFNDGAWKSNLVWDTSSCPDALLSTYYNYDYSTAKCYTEKNVVQ